MLVLMCICVKEFKSTFYKNLYNHLFYRANLRKNSHISNILLKTHEIFLFKNKFVLSNEKKDVNLQSISKNIRMDR